MKSLKPGFFGEICLIVLDNFYRAKMWYFIFKYSATTPFQKTTPKIGHSNRQMNRTAVSISPKAPQLSHWKVSAAPGPGQARSSLSFHSSWRASCMKAVTQRGLHVCVCPKLLFLCLEAAATSGQHAKTGEFRFQRGFFFVGSGWLFFFKVFNLNIDSISTNDVAFFWGS